MEAPSELDQNTVQHKPYGNVQSNQNTKSKFEGLNMA